MAWHALAPFSHKSQDQHKTSLFLLQRVGQFDGREEAHAFTLMLDSLDAEGRGNMRFPSARTPINATFSAASRNSHQ